MLKSIHQSHIGAFFRCARQFYYRYEEDLKIPPGIAARQGSAVHKSAEINHLQKIETGIDIHVDELKAIARDEYKALIEEEGIYISPIVTKDKSEISKLVGAGLDKAIAATETYSTDVAPTIQPEIVEEYIRADLPGWDLPLAGTIDVTDTDGNIRDLKIKGMRLNQKSADRSFQPIVYSVLFREQTGEWPNDFRFEVIVLNKKSTVYAPIITRKYPDDIKRLEHYVEIMLRQIESGLYPPADPDHWICDPKWCGYFNKTEYFNGCPYGAAR